MCAFMNFDETYFNYFILIYIMEKKNKKNGQSNSNDFKRN